MSKNPTPKLTSEFKRDVAVPDCLFSQGSLALRFTFQYDFYEECPVPDAVSWVHSLIQSLYSWGDIWELCVLGGGYSCDAPLGPSLGWGVLGMHGEDEGLCTLSCWEGARGAEVFPSRNVNFLGEFMWFYDNFLPFILLKAGGVKEGKLTQSNGKVGSSKLCYCSSTVLVISGFLLEFGGEREEQTRAESVSEGWACCWFSLLSVSHPRPQ